MASSASVATGDPALARGAAREILAERRFHAAPVPRPLHGVLQAIGNALEAPLQAIEELFSSATAGVPGGSITVWGVLGVVVLALSGLLAHRRARRSLSEPRDADIPGGDRVQLDAGALRRQALAAERDGRHADAVRLRFQAGLLALGERELVAFVPSMSNAEVSRALGSGRFDQLAHDFDEIVYGGRRALAEDSETARRDWETLLASKVHR
jgi:uncharacterized protein DUF4129